MTEGKATVTSRAFPGLTSATSVRWIPHRWFLTNILTYCSLGLLGVGDIYIVCYNLYSEKALKNDLALVPGSSYTDFSHCAEKGLVKTIVLSLSVHV